MFNARLVRMCSFVVGACLALAATLLGQVEGMKDASNRQEVRNVHRNALQDSTLVAAHKNFTLYSMTSKDLQSLDVSVSNAQGNPLTVQGPKLGYSRLLNIECIQYAAGNTYVFELDLSP